MRSATKNKIKRILEFIAFGVIFISNYIFLNWPSLLFWGMAEEALGNYKIDVIPSGRISGLILISSTALMVDMLITFAGIHLYKISKKKWLFWIIYLLIAIGIAQFTAITFVPI